jgi:Rrf2 family protein
MLKLSKKTEYAIIALLDMAGNEDNQLTTVKDLSQKYNIPRDLMGKVMQNLVKQGLIMSQQGVKGGYKIARPAGEININSVIQAVDGPISLVDCKIHDRDNCDQLEFCNIKSPMHFIHSELLNFFNGITLDDFNKKFKRKQELVKIQSPLVPESLSP